MGQNITATSCQLIYQGVFLIYHFAINNVKLSMQCLEQPEECDTYFTEETTRDSKLAVNTLSRGILVLTF